MVQGETVENMKEKTELLLIFMIFVGKNKKNHKWASAWPAWFPPVPPPPFCRHGTSCLPVDYPLYTTNWTHGACDVNKALCFIPCTIFHSPPRLSILIYMYLTHDVPVSLMSSLVYSCPDPSPSTWADEGRHTNPSSWPSLYLPILNCLCTYYLS